MTLLSRALPERAARPVWLPNATLVGRHDLTDSLAEISLDLDSPLRPFLAGQYVSLGITHEAGTVQRPYSVVSLDVTRRRIELFIRRIPTGELSRRIWQLPAGSRVRIGPARGLFTLDIADTRPRLFVASGTGLAPFMAMLEQSARRAEHVPTTLILGVSYRDELAYVDRIARWTGGGLPIDFRPTVSRAGYPRNAGWVGLVGRAEAEVDRMLKAGHIAPGASVVYLCGNPEMIAACSALLTEAGVPPQDVRIEQFHAPTAGFAL